MMKRFFPTIFLVMVTGWLASAFADIGYISDTVRVILRSGPGTEYRIITTLESGQKLVVIDESDDWNRIRLPDEQEGWIMQRFISKEPPAALLLENCREEYDRMLTRLEVLQAETRESDAENVRLQQELKTIRTQFRSVSAAHEALQQESAGFLTLKERHQTASEALAAMEKDYQRLEKKLNDQYTEILLTGAGILLAGLLVGLLLGIRRRRSGSALYR